MFRLAVLSDIHGNLIALEAVLADLARQGDVDKLWCLGDLAAFGPRAGECVAKLRALQAEWGEDRLKIISGNTDRYLVTGERMRTPPAKDGDGMARRIQAFVERDTILNWNLARLDWDDYEFLAKILGRELHQSVTGYGDVLGVHAIPGDDESFALRHDSPEEEALDALLDREGRLVLTGHTHTALDRQLASWRIVNPGSVGLSMTHPGMAEWALLTFGEAGEISVDLRRIPLDVEAVLADARKADYPDMPGLEKRLHTQ